MTDRTRRSAGASPFPGTRAAARMTALRACRTPGATIRSLTKATADDMRCTRVAARVPGKGLAPADLRVRSVMQEDPGRVYETVLDLCRR